MDGVKIETIGQASAAIAAYQPLKLEIGESCAASIRKMDWRTWRAIWQKIKGMIGVGVQTWNALAADDEARGLFADTTARPVAQPQLQRTAEGDEYKGLDPETYAAITKATQEMVFRSQMNVAGAVDKAVGLLADIPDLVEEVLCGSVHLNGEPLTAAVIPDLPGPTVLTLFWASLQHNFFKDQEVLDFSAGVKATWPVKPGATNAGESEPAPSPEVNKASEDAGSPATS